MVERLGIPGFLRGRRCMALDGGIEFLTLYEVSGPEVLDSEVYKRRVTNPSPWSAKVLPGFRNNVRGSCRIASTSGPAMGGFLLSLRFEAEPDREAALVESVSREVMPSLASIPRITGAHFLTTEPSLSGANVGQQRGRMITLPSLIILVEGSTADGVSSVGEAQLGDDRLVGLGAKPGTLRGVYQLEYSISNIA